MVVSPFHHHKHQQHQRRLDDSYLADSDGKAYNSYSLAWRYLGLFIDCGEDEEDEDDRRRLGDSGDGVTCTRKVLWAAYRNKDYGGRSIGEYQFFDRKTNRWDASTCRPQSVWNIFHRECRRMDCHEARTDFELVGVFTETDGLYDWTEQLFKHHGYCLWGGDKEDENENGDENENENENRYGDYNFMQNLQEKFIYGCTQLDGDYYDDDGNNLYVDIKPQSLGDMTIGVYTDSSCSIESSLTWFDVNNADDDDEDDGNDRISADAIDRWNDLMGDYKICQPCRAYNRVVTTEVKSNDSGSRDENKCNEQSGSNDRSGSNSNDENDGGAVMRVFSRMYQTFYRFVTGHYPCDDDEHSESYDGEDEEEEEEDNDGDGSDEQWGFDCNDDAGYLNCNQCYKFETQTDLELTSTYELELATKQGTILAIDVNGVRYGSSRHEESMLRRISLIFLISAVALAGLTYAILSWKRYRRIDDEDMKERLTHAASPTTGDDRDVERFDNENKKKINGNGSSNVENIYLQNPFTYTVSYQKKMNELEDEYRTNMSTTGMDPKEIDERVDEYRKELDLKRDAIIMQDLDRDRNGNDGDRKEEVDESLPNDTRRDVIVAIVIVVFIVVIVATSSLAIFITIAVFAFVTVFAAVLVATVNEFRNNSVKKKSERIKLKDKIGRNYDKEKREIL